MDGGRGPHTCTCTVHDCTFTCTESLYTCTFSKPPRLRACVHALGTM